MEQRILRWDGSGCPYELADVPDLPIASGWIWIDLRPVPDAPPLALDHLVRGLGLDQLAAHDALYDVDLPKVDDFGNHLLIVLHELAKDRIETYEVDCFLTAQVLITVHDEDSPSINALWRTLQTHEALAQGGASDVSAMLADGVTRRLLAVIDAFDERLEDLTTQALNANPSLLADVSAVRSDLAAVRKVVNPQRETLDVMRTIRSPLLSEQARRRYADVGDVAGRLTSGLDAARSALAETIDVYRGAEAKSATDVTKVLTVYSAVMLPITLVASYFGMNHENLPTVHEDWGWIAVTIFMALIAIVSLGTFIAAGWIRRPSGRQAGEALGRGLVEAAMTPVHLAEAVMGISAMPLRKAIDSVLPNLPDNIDEREVRRHYGDGSHGGE